MKKKSLWRMVHTGRTNTTRRWVRVAALGVFALAGTGRAQSVIAPPPPMVSTTPPAVAEQGPGEMQVFPSALENYLEELHPLQWGTVTLHPHVAYSFTDSLGVRSSTNAPPQDTIVQSLSPGVLFVLSRHWTLDYTPTFTFYSNNHFEDNVSHAFSLNGGTTYEDWGLGLSQGVTYSTTPQVQTGSQTTDTSVSTSLSASHSLNSKLSLSLSVNQSLNFPSGFQSTKAWSTSAALNYAFWARFSAGITVGFGYTMATPNSFNEQLQGQVSWRVTDRLSIAANGGAQSTQFTSGGGSPLGNPIFGLAIQDQLFDHTQLSVNATQGLTTSYYENQVPETTTVGANVSQGLFRHFTLNVGGSYSWTTYHAAANNVSVNSDSEYYSVNVSLNTTIFKRVAVSSFYSHSANITSQHGQDFASNQVGFSLGCAF
jgi:hypothetical protein